MKILIVGTWRWNIYEESFSRGLVANDVEVYPFKTAAYFQGQLGNIQEALPLPGPALLMLNHKLLQEARRIKPDLILFWRPVHILSSSLKKLTDQGFKLISYNNDDPFGHKMQVRVPWHHHLLWRNYLACLPYFHRNFFYRKINCDEAFAFGAKNAGILLPYFLPWRDRPIQLNSDDRQRFNADIVFVGHYENDGRVQMLQKLDENGFKIRLWGGTHWTRKTLGSLYEKLAPIRPAEGEEYIKALSGAKICLAFLSKINRDTYTRRCFEIPASRRVMLAERTDDLKHLFKEDDEACYFSSTHELIEKCTMLLNDFRKRDSIANAGYRRVWNDKHDVESRAKQFLDKLEF